jgi:hypothetical protein
MRGSTVRSVVALCVLGWAASVPVAPAQASTPAECTLEKGFAEFVAQDFTLEGPAEGAEVPEGAPVTLLGKSVYGPPLTFSVASSPALLPSPDIDGGPGSLQPGTSDYTFTSTKATAASRTVYWAASFTVTLKACEAPSTFTTATRTLTVRQSLSPPEQARAKKQQEAAAKAKQEEATPAGSVSLDGSTITVQRTHRAAVKLACRGTATCKGKLTLTARITIGKSKRKRSRTASIASASFSIGAGKVASVRLTLNGTGRALLTAARGHLSSVLMILEIPPAPAAALLHALGLPATTTQRHTVRLVQQKQTGATRTAS